MHHHQLVHEALGENELGIRKTLPQHVVLVHRQIVVVPGVDLDEADAAALEPELLETLHHDLGIAAVAAVPDVGQRIGALAAAGFGVGAAHGEHQGRLAVERHHDV